MTINKIQVILNEDVSIDKKESKKESKKEDKEKVENNK